MNIALMVDDRIEMSIEELCEYYGVDYVPDVLILKYGRIRVALSTAETAGPVKCIGMAMY